MPNQENPLEGLLKDLPASIDLLSPEKAKKKLKKLGKKDRDKPEFVFERLLELMETDIEKHSGSVDKKDIDDIVIMKNLVIYIVIVGLKTSKKLLEGETREKLLDKVEELHEQLEKKLFNLSNYGNELATRFLTTYEIYLEAVCNAKLGKFKNRAAGRFGNGYLDNKKELAKKSIGKISEIKKKHGLFKEPSSSSERHLPASSSSCVQPQLGAAS